MKICFSLTGDIIAGLYTWPIHIQKNVIHIFISLPAQCDVNAPQGYTGN